MTPSLSLEAEVTQAKPNSEWIASLSSCIAHLVILILLALVTARVGKVGTLGPLVSGPPGDSDVAQLMELAAPDAINMDAEPTDIASSMSPISMSMGEVPNIHSFQNSMESTEPSNAPSSQVGEMLQEAQLSNGSGAGTGNGFAITSLEGRSKGNRNRLAMENGGSAESERAVELALDYLARHQSNDGSWSMNFDDEPCNGECSPSCSGIDPYHYGATGLALLCFLGAGKTTSDEEYGNVVSKGIYFLVQTLRRDSTYGYWLDKTAAEQMYEHGIATLALTEALQLTENQEIREACQLAVNFIVEAQFRDGSWNYHPREPGDLSIVAWQAMALKSAAAAKLVVPPKTIRGIDQYLEHSRGGEFMFRYRDRRPTKSMTAIGALLMIFRGRSKDMRDIASAIEYLHKQQPDPKDMYYNYYATQAMFQVGGKYWKNWNYYMRDYLIQNQVQEGHMAGSWWFDRDYSNLRGGRLYVTCMACLTLEVYYRYLPVYGNSPDEFRL